jgi:hypothetical protein
MADELARIAALAPTIPEASPRDSRSSERAGK